VPPAVELRERAAAKFKEAHDLVEGKDELSSEDEAKFASIMAEAKSADEAYMKASGREEDLAGLKDRLSFYHESATGKPVNWDKISEGKSAQAGLPHYAGGLLVPEHAKSLGEAFVMSDEYKELKGSGALSDGSKVPFRTNPVELKAASDIISSTSAAAGDRLGPSAGLNIAQFLPTVLPLPQQPLTVRDLFSQATTSADLISYARQTSFDNAAATVAEAAVDGTPSGAKPQSSIAFTRVTTPVETIATWMAATRQQLADAGQLRSLIDNQGRLMIQLEEEDQLLNGNGTAPNISGLLDQPTIQTLDLSAATGDRANLDGLRTAKRMVRTGTARASADGVIVHPADSEEFDLMVDEQGRYRAGDPFGVLGPSSDAPPIWRMRRVESEAVAEGTAIVGAFKQGATVFERNGVQVFTSDSHSDFFIKNLVAILFEERLALAVFFPTAFVEVTLKDWAEPT
jgi:HK97 family phage major capsid protein